MHSKTSRRHCAGRTSIVWPALLHSAVPSCAGFSCVLRLRSFSIKRCSCGVAAVFGSVTRLACKTKGASRSKGASRAKPFLLSKPTLPAKTDTLIVVVPAGLRWLKTANLITSAVASTGYAGHERALTRKDTDTKGHSHEGDQTYSLRHCPSWSRDIFSCVTN